MPVDGISAAVEIDPADANFLRVVSQQVRGNSVLEVSAPEWNVRLFSLDLRSAPIRTLFIQGDLCIAPDQLLENPVSSGRGHRNLQGFIAAGDVEALQSFQMQMDKDGGGPGLPGSLQLARSDPGGTPDGNGRGRFGGLYRQLCRASLCLADLKGFPGGPPHGMHPQIKIASAVP